MTRAQPAFGMAVNYAAPPPAVERDYNTRDRLAIAARMLTVQKYHREGANLTDGPYPVDPQLVEALRRHAEQVDQVLQVGTADRLDINL